MNPYYYLFYKLSRFLNNKGNNEWGVIYAISILIGWNIVFFYIKLFHIALGNSQGIYKTILIAIAILLFVTNCVLFLNRDRVKRIMNRYKLESVTCKKVGNFLVILYIFVSLGLILFS